MANYAQLKCRHRTEREGHPQNTALRIHRALSWLHRAEQSEDSDGRFVFLWIAFNAAYSNEYNVGKGYTESDKFKKFIHNVVKLDQSRMLEELVCNEFANSIHSLLNNKYVLHEFWDQVNTRNSEVDWQGSLARDKRAARHALKNRQTEKVLTLVFKRLYVLRNQIIHGGATWDSGVNRDQVYDGAEFLGKLVPRIIEILLDHPQHNWGEVAYPVDSAINQ